MALATSPAFAQTLSTYGTPGLIEMPTASVLRDGELSFSGSYFGPHQRYAATFQILPRVSGTFRYSIIQGFDANPDASIEGDRFDRSFDVHFQFLDENQKRPAVAVGLRDVLGTGLYAAEYLVATKTVASKFKVTAGLGWGRLAGVGSFSNPLGFIDDRFDTRPGQDGDPGGQLSAENWFRGPAAFFGGVEYQANDRTSYFVEYSSDAYAREVEQPATGLDIKTPINFGIEYQFKNGLRAKGFVIGGSEIGFQLSYIIDPARRNIPGGTDPAPLALVPLNQAAFSGLNLDQPTGFAQAQQVLSNLLKSEGMELQGFTLNDQRAEIRLQNNRYDIEAQAVGRAARAMAVALPSNIETFVITFQDRGIPISSITMQRSDFVELETDFDGSWKLQARVQIEDAVPSDRRFEVPGAFPRFRYGLGPYFALAFFDPDNPLRYELGAELTSTYQPTPGVTISGKFRYPFVGNIDDADRTSDSVLPRVRSDAFVYAQQSDFEINELTADYRFRPGKDLFGRVTFGYLENMFGGISGELLWYPLNNRLALGAEVNYVKQRDFDMLFGFQDYDVVTGHASAYYDLGNGFTTQIDVGRYLAGDWGATFALDRVFKNGFKVGGYFTLTDVSAEEFGEGSFDKGLRISVPLSWLTGRSSRETFDQKIQPVLRDGGARLNVSNRLYEVTRDYRAVNLRDGWGRVYR
ncbi:YjbH domain-containing protein [Tateyamaria sp.]|uniref:YjbH domain-containing protein n=1 Tax=Tateyamaria sp. TaxID=1929288 RepID=UPI00329F2F3D